MYIILLGIMIVLFLVLVFISFVFYIKEINKEVFIHKAGEGKFNVYLSRESVQKLEELRNATGKETLSETLRCALKLYDKEKHGE